MPLFLVTGLPGTGKSTVCAELKTRGFESYDGDYDHLAHWYNNGTGQPEEHDQDRTPEFLRTHSRDIARETVDGLAANAQDKSVFLCGDPENEDELVDLFAKVFALILDEDTRQYRLATRTNNQWGKLPHEIEYDLATIPIAYDRYQRLAYITLDSAQSTEIIVDQIIELI